MSNGPGDSDLVNDFVSEIRRMNFPNNKPVFYIENGWIIRESSDGSKIRVKEYTYRPPKNSPTL